MLITQGGRFGGCGFYLLKGKPVFTWNLVDLKRVRWEGPEALTPGKHSLEFDFKYDGLIRRIFTYIAWFVAKFPNSGRINPVKIALAIFLKLCAAHTIENSPATFSLPRILHAF